MEYIAPSQLLRELDRQLFRIISAVPIRTIDSADRVLLESVRPLASFALKHINEYELGDSREEQQRFAADAIERLEKLQKAILACSERGYIGAVDVADTTSQIDRLVAVLRR